MSSLANPACTRLSRISRVSDASPAHPDATTQHATAVATVWISVLVVILCSAFFLAIHTPNHLSRAMTRPHRGSMVGVTFDLRTAEAARPISRDMGVATPAWRHDKQS